MAFSLHWMPTPCVVGVKDDCTRSECVSDAYCLRIADDNGDAEKPSGTCIIGQPLIVNRRCWDSMPTRRRASPSGVPAGLRGRGLRERVVFEREFVVGNRQPQRRDATQQRRQHDL